MNPRSWRRQDLPAHHIRISHTHIAFAYRIRISHTHIAYRISHTHTHITYAYACRIQVHCRNENMSMYSSIRVCTRAGTGWGEGDTIGMTIDFNDLAVDFYLNGVFVYTFRGIVGPVVAMVELNDPRGSAAFVPFMPDDVRAMPSSSR